jgi:hypothetical protein
MAASQLPVRSPERQPETNTAPRTTWPRPSKKEIRFVIKLGGIVPG